MLLLVTSGTIGRVVMSGEPLKLFLGFLETAHDPGAFASPEGCLAWLQARHLVAAGVGISDDEFWNVRRVRAALVSLLAEHAGSPPDPRTRPTIAAAMDAAPLAVSIDADGTPRLVASGTPVNAALGTLLGILYASSLTGQFERMKACRACGWPFYDASKNRSRVWCDMKLCGSREKARTYRQRRGAAGGA